MILTAMPHCCGLREINGLGAYDPAKRKPKTPEEHIADMWHPIYMTSADYPAGRTNWRYAIFTQAHHPEMPCTPYGEEFAAYIRAHELGEVIETTGRHINPNSGNVLKVWVWTVDHDRTREAARVAFQNRPQQKEPTVSPLTVGNNIPRTAQERAELQRAARYRSSQGTAVTVSGGRDAHK